MLDVAQVAERAAAVWNASQKNNWRALKPVYSDEERSVLAFLVKRVQAKEFGAKKASNLFHDLFPWRTRGSVRGRIRKALKK